MIPSDWYFNPELYQREREIVFFHNWALFCPEHELSKPGFYKADCINGYEIIVVRTKQGEIKGFHNSCRHRGTMLKQHESGSVNLLVCPYHAWTYDLEGKLTKTPGFEAPTGFNKKDFGLRSVRTGTWGGLVFICLDNTAPDLQSWLGSLPRLCEEYPSPLNLAYYDQFSVLAKQNWKLFCENTIEGYHLPMVHADLYNMVDKDKLSIKEYDDGALIVFHVTYKTDGIGKRGNSGIWWYRFPGFQGVCGARSFRADRIDSITPESSRIIDWSWNEEGMSEAEAREGFRFAKQIVEEDIRPCESIQRNLRSGSFEQGVLSPTKEKYIINFHERLRGLLGER